MADKPNITKEGYVAQLVRTGVWATPQNPIQYAFLEQKPGYVPNEPGWTPLSAAQRAAVQNAFAMIAEVVNLTFVQVPDNQQQPGPGNPRIAFYANSIDLSYSGGMFAFRNQGSYEIYGADIRFNTARIAQRQSNEGWQDFTSFVALHEVLHAMGLSHPGDYNGQGPTYQNNAEFVEDTVQYSVMSYFGAANTGADHTIGNVLYGGRTPLLYDILALQSLYSPNMSTRAGDTVYGFNSNTGASSPFNFAVTTGPVVAIWDGGGIDTIDLSGYGSASLIDLNEGAFSDAGGLTKNIAIAFNVTIENAVGGTGNDRLVGNAVANRLDGGAGADQMEGGQGDDVYVVDDLGDLVVELPGAGRDEVRTALAAYVLPADVENLTGTSPSAQTLTGNGLANSLAGGAGDDTLSGGAGDDALDGGAGDGDTAVYAGNRADYEIGTAGQVTVRDLNAAGGDDGTDSLSGIEFVRFADMVVDLGVDPNNPPVLGQPAMVDQSWADGQAATYAIPGTSFIDVDGQHTLAFRAALADGSVLPAWLSFDASTRTFSGTPPLAAVGATLAIRVTADDGQASVSDDFTIGVTQAPGADVNGTDGADLLDGTFRAERMFGFDGDDVLRGSPGADRLHGVAGTDEADYSASPAGVTIDLGTGIGSGGHAEGDELFSIERVTGSAHSDAITGTVGNDAIDGGAGADTMEGGAGDDLYLVDDSGDAVVERPNEGTDEVRTSLASHALAAEVERLVGLSGAGQALSGNALANVIVGGAGADRLDGGGGADSLAGGPGNDIYFVDEAGDTVTEAANAGIDEVRTSLAAYALAAEVENLTGLAAAGQALTGNGLANIVTGAGGNDMLDGGAAADQLIGGLGNDLYFVDSGDIVTEGPGAGTDEVRSALAAYTLAADVENLTGTAATGQALTGNGLANIITAGAGDDILDGGAGADQLAGGLGNDLYLVDSGDTVTEGPGAGTDEVRTALATSALAANVENLTGTAATGQALTGNGLTNLITAGAGNDILDGGAGADQLAGGLGNDIYLVDAGDTVVEAADGGTDEIRTAFAAHALGANVENLTGTAATGQALTGNILANRLTGGAGNDTLDGGAGADVLAGGAGDDSYRVDDPNDAIVELAGEGANDRVYASGGYVLGAGVGVEILSTDSDTGMAPLTLAGNELDNRIIGNAGANMLYGMGGIDRLEGLAGNDGYVVDRAEDVVVEAVGQGYDTIFAPVSYALAAGSEVEALSTLDRLGTQAIDFTGNAFRNALYGNAGANQLSGGAGDDMLDGGAGDDRLDGGADVDTASYADAGSAVTVSLALATAQNTGGAGSDTLIDVENLVGSAYGDTLTGNGFANVLTGGAGADTLRGGGGNDTYVVEDAGDVVVENAGEGADEVRTALASFSLVAAANVENLTATSNVNHDFRGNAGANRIEGGSGNDVLRLYDGGADVVLGGGGDDNIFFIGALDSGDVVNGGGGMDTLVLQGPYGALVLSPYVFEIENISLLGGNNVNFGEPGSNRYDYGLKTNDANFAAGVQARINGSALLAGEDFTFDGSAETNASFVVYGGKGKDTLTGGLGNDIFFYAEERFATGDTVNGGAGYDGMFLRGNYTIDFNAPGYTGLFTNIENLTLTSATDERYARGGGTEFDYNLTLSNAIVKPGETLTISGALLMATETMVLDAGQEADGFLRLFGGRASDTLKGGANADLIHGNLGADQLTGNGGADTFRYDSTAESNPGSMDQITDFTPGTDKLDLSRIDANTPAPGDQGFSWIGSNAFSGVAGQLRAVQQGGQWIVQGDTDGDSVADLVIALTLQGAAPLGAGDFLL